MRVSLKVSLLASLLAAPLTLLPLAPAAAQVAAPIPDQATPVTPPQAPEGKVILTERAEIRVRLKAELKSGRNKKDEEVPFEVAQDVFGPGRTLLIAAGTPAYGKVTDSKRRGMFGKPGKLGFTCDYVLAPDGTHIPLRSDPLGGRGKNNQTAAIATTLFLTVFGAFVNGKDVTVPKDKEFPMYIAATTTVTSPGAATTPVVLTPASVPAKSLFLMKNGKEIIGVLVSFDGAAYTVSTDQGTKTISAKDVKTVYPLAAAPAAASAIPSVPVKS